MGRRGRQQDGEGGLRGELLAAHEAFQEYVAAKRKMDETLSFWDAHDAAQKWVRFLNLYLSDGEEMPEIVKAIGNVVPFPKAINQPDKNALADEARRLLARMDERGGRQNG